MTTSFERFMTVTASTKRATLSGGKRGSPATQVASLRCTPLDPVTAEIQQRLQLNTPHELLQTFTQETDIKEGDVLVVAGTEYPIRAVENWAVRSGGDFLRLVVEELKR